MTVVLVHGNPETAAIWDPLRAELGRDDVVALSPPGFGAPGARRLRGDVRRLPRLADRRGGAAADRPSTSSATTGAAGTSSAWPAPRPDLIRSWATDIAGAADPAYVWHDMAQVWQTPGEGEAFVDAMMSMPATDRAAALRRRPG